MKMKKLISALLALSMALSVCACSFAEGSTVTLAELKATAPESVSFTIGSEVYDAPVVLPEAEEIPLLVCQYQTFDTTNLREKYLYEKERESFARQADAFYNYEGSPMVSYDMGSFYARHGRTDVSARYALPMGETPPEIDLTPDDLAQFVLDRMVEFGGDSATDLRVWRSVAWSGKCYVKMVKYTSPDGKVIFRMPAADPKKPVKNGSKGAWDVQFAQYVHGAPIFPYTYWPTAESRRGGAGTELGMYYVMIAFSSSIYFVDENLMGMGAAAANVTDTLLFDTPLASFQTIMDAIQKRIDEEQLQSVFRITLGYTPVPVKGEPFSPVFNERPNADARYVLVPTWNVEGYDLKDRSSREGYGYTAPSREEAYQAASVDSSYFELRFDAQTGELLKYYEYDLEGFAK